MVVFKVIDTKEIVILLFICIFVAYTAVEVNANEINCADGSSNAFDSNKITQNTPVLINIRPNLVKSPKLLSKLMRVKMAETKLSFKAPAPRRRRSIGIPRLPLVPFIIPLLPRILPLLPSALVPTARQGFPGLKTHKKLNLVRKNNLSPRDKIKIAEKLHEMKKQGALTYAEFYRFRKVLLT